MLLTDLIPDISLLIPQSYEEIKTPETEKLLMSFFDSKRKLRLHPNSSICPEFPAPANRRFIAVTAGTNTFLSVLTPLWNNSPPIDRNCKTPVPLRLSKNGKSRAHHRL